MEELEIIRRTRQQFRQEVPKTKAVRMQGEARLGGVTRTWPTVDVPGEGVRMTLERDE